jgi:hypothetical protein
MAPDILAFGPFFVSRFFDSAWQTFPTYVHVSYSITHSLVVWTAVAGTIWYFSRGFPWIVGAWGLHVICDIPLHELSFFPTPYLWPLPTPLVNGYRWAQPAIMIPNYAAIIVAYTLWMGLRYRREKSNGRVPSPSGRGWPKAG